MTQAPVFILDLGLFEDRCGSVDWSEAIVWDLLRVLCYANRRVLECGNIPPLYESGVRYMTDAESPYWKKLLPNLGKEIFMAIPAILRDGGADCEDLSSWRVAELRHAGEGTWPVRVDAREQFVMRKWQTDDGLLYHIQVQRLGWDPVNGAWYKADVEDPSRILGMGEGRGESAVSIGRNVRS